MSATGHRPRSRLAYRECHRVLARRRSRPRARARACDRGRRRGSWTRAGRTGLGVRALSPRQGEPRWAGGHRPRSADRARASAQVGCRDDHCQSKRRRSMCPDRVPSGGDDMTTGRRAVAGWIALALVGLVVAVGVAYAASLLASPDVGLTSEPLSAGARLAPRTRPATKPPQKHHAPAPPPANPAPAPSPTPTPSPPAATPAPRPAPVPAPGAQPAPPAATQPHREGDDHPSGGDD